MTEPTQHTEQSTQHSDRVARRLEAHKAAITASKITVQVHIPLPRVKLPPADDRVKRKIRVHLLCIVIGAALVGACDMLLGNMFVLHYGTFVQTGPNLAMEYLDRVRNR